MSAINKPAHRNPNIWWSSCFFIQVLYSIGHGSQDANNPSADRAFNRSEIQALYLSGEFDPLVALLEHIRHARKMRDREDSVFIYKYLGVIYGADEKTRKKAESFLYQLLKLNPDADLSDMGVGENIDSLFVNVRHRYKSSYRDTTSETGRQQKSENLSK